MDANTSMTCCTSNGASTPATCTPSASGETRRTDRPASSTYRPAVDVLETDDAYRIVADLPGARAETVNITFEDGVLTLEADVPDRSAQHVSVLRQEYGVGSFVRRFRVHGEVDPDAIAAAFAHGVLEITLPKSSRSQRRRVPVSAS